MQQQLLAAQAETLHRPALLALLMLQADERDGERPSIAV